MDHKAMKDKIFALYDGELEGASRQEAEAHLAACAECRRTYENWTKTAKILFKAPSPAPSEFFVQSVMNRIRDLEAPKPAREWRISLPWLVPALGFAFMFVLAVVPSPQFFTLDNWLIQDSSMAFSNSAPNADETLQWVMEESL